MSEASLSGADLSGASLDGANLTRANLQDADLSKADINGAILNETNLSRTILTGTIICIDECNWFDVIKKGKVIEYEKIIKEYIIKEELGYYFEHGDESRIFTLYPK